MRARAAARPRGRDRVCLRWERSTPSTKLLYHLGHGERGARLPRALRAGPRRRAWRKAALDRPVGREGRRRASRGFGRRRTPMGRGLAPTGVRWRGFLAERQVRTRDDAPRAAALARAAPRCRRRRIRHPRHTLRRGFGQAIDGGCKGGGGDKKSRRRPRLFSRKQRMSAARGNILLIWR